MSSDLNQLAWDTVDMKLVNIDGVILPEDYKQIADAVENFEVYDDDVYVCSFPKSGTTWTQEMVWCIAHDLNLERAKVHLNARFPLLEYSGVTTVARAALRGSKLNWESWISSSVDYCTTLPRPRFMQTHLTFDLLPRQIRTGAKKPKIVYVARNPKDVCISYYHHCNLLEGFCGSLDDLCKSFLEDEVSFGPYWNNLRSYWNLRHKDNVLFIKFEDMKKDLASVVRKTAGFMGKNLADEQVKILCRHLSFACMKVNPAVNRSAVIECAKKLNLTNDEPGEKEFIRNGNVGQWKTMMRDEWIEKFDEWQKKNIGCCEGLTF